MEVGIIATLITAAVAVYAAVLSTINYLSNRKKDKKYLTITINIGLAVNGFGQNYKILIIECNNRGFRTITLTSFRIILPGDNTLICPRPSGTITLPYELKEGKNGSLWLELNDIAENLKNSGYTGTTKIKAEFCDGAGDRYLSKPFPFKVEEWLNKSN